jgi:hypothetical protein
LAPDRRTLLALALLPLQALAWSDPFLPPVQQRLTDPGRVEVPLKLQLTRIDPLGSSALINGQRLAEGQTIENQTVIRIEPGRVQLKQADGTLRWIELGAASSRKSP